MTGSHWPSWLQLLGMGALTAIGERGARFISRIVPPHALTHIRHSEAVIADCLC